MKVFPCFFIFLFFASVCGAAPQVEHAAVYRAEHSDALIYSGEIFLPEGAWKLAQAAGENDKARFYLLAPREKQVLARAQKAERERQDKLIEKGKKVLTVFYRALRNHAETHGNIGPGSLDDLDPVNREFIEKESAGIWSAETGRTLQEPYVFLMPEAQFIIETDRRILPHNKKLLMLEMQPYFDDDWQWKLYTDGSCIREKIDQDFMLAHDLTVRPASREKILQAEERRSDQEENNHLIVAELDRTATGGPFSLTFENTREGRKIEVSWQPEQMVREDPFIRNYRDFARMKEMAPYRNTVPASPVYRLWMSEKSWAGFTADRMMIRERERGGRELTPFNVLGGRAAIEETLQLQSLLLREGGSPDETVPIAAIKGVEVKSHPFAAMLAGEKGESLQLADYVPYDRFLVYTAQPAAILPFLDGGARFMARLGGIIQANSIRYDLKDRYLSRLGLDSDWLQAFIKSGAVRESAFIFPDLFFIEGTDMTIVSRLAMPRLIGSFLEMAGIGNLTAGNIFIRTLDSGQEVLWALRGDILVISTSRREMEAVLALQAAGGQGSLGQSAEFSYMLSQTPVLPETRFYAYFSDPFIRHLVGPATKIGQLRRLAVRSNLEELTAGALLAKLDGYTGPFSIAALVEAGYAAPRMAFTDLSIDDEGLARSAAYGSLSELRSLASVDLEEASGAESEAYNTYLQNYNQYWRQYFDPIAIRLDDVEDGALELTTFILPLIENSFYNIIRQVLADGSGVPLKVPVISPEPVVMFSMNLQERARQHLTEGSMFFSRYTHLNPGILNTLGPGVHLAIMDADPVIALGSGDILGAFNAGSLGFAGGEMMFMPMALSILTRPCTLYIETGNPGKTLEYLRQASIPAVSRQDGIKSDFYQLAGRDEWIYSFNLFGLIKLRYGIEVKNGYLVIRNIPWAPREQVGEIREMALNGALLQAFPSACASQLPGIFTSAAEKNRTAALQGMGYLYPILASGYAPVQDAARAHARLFGFRPVHPGDGGWEWDGRDIISDRYGSVRLQRQPSYGDGDRSFGLLQDIDHLSLNLRFEDTGLRTSLRWKLR